MNVEFFYVDRLEGERVICETENGETQTFLKSDFPFSVYEGAVLEKSDNGAFSLNIEKEEERREYLFKLQQNLFE